MSTCRLSSSARTWLSKLAQLRRAVPLSGKVVRRRATMTSAGAPATGKVRSTRSTASKYRSLSILVSPSITGTRSDADIGPVRGSHAFASHVKSTGARFGRTTKTNHGELPLRSNRKFRLASAGSAGAESSERELAGTNVHPARPVDVPEAVRCCASSATSADCTWSECIMYSRLDRTSKNGVRVPMEVVQVVCNIIRIERLRFSVDV